MIENVLIFRKRLAEQRQAVAFWVTLRTKTQLNSADSHQIIKLNARPHTSVLTLFPGTLQRGLYWRDNDSDLKKLVRAVTASALIQCYPTFHRALSALALHYTLNQNLIINNDDDL